MHWVEGAHLFVSFIGGRGAYLLDLSGLEGAYHFVGGRGAYLLSEGEVRIFY